MANNMIALQARAPQSDFLGGAIQRNAQMINMARQQDAADRQAAAAARNAEIAMAQEQRAAALAKPQMMEAEQKATSAQAKAVGDFLGLSIEGMKMARSAEDAVKIGDWLKSQFPQAEFQQAVDQTLSSLPQNPAQFEDWRKQTLYQSMEAKDQLEQHFETQNTGRETWQTAAPKYAGAPGGMKAEEIPGTRVQAAEDIIYIRDENGQIRPMPRTLPGTGGAVGTGGATGGADTVYGFGKYGSPDKPLSSMPIGEVQKFQRDALIPATRGKVGAGPDQGTGAVGTYQITYGTLQKYAPKVLGANWEKVPFTADVQDQIARAIYEDVKGGDLKQTWAGLPSNKPGAYANVPWEQVRGKIAQAETGGGKQGGGLQMGTPIEGTSDTDQQRKAFGKILPIIGYNPKTGKDLVSDLIGRSTSGGAEMLGSEASAFVTGKATPGREALGQLRAIADNMTFEKLRGKLGAQISDADVRLIANTMADIANGNIPANERAAAWKNVVLPILLRGAGVEAPAAAATDNRPKPTPADVQAVRRNRGDKNWTEGFRRHFGDQALKQALGGR